MIKKLLGLTLLCFGLGACSSEPLEDPQELADAGKTGMLGLSLTSEASGSSYRLAGAKFTISSAALKAKSFTASEDKLMHTETLPVGKYALTLESGWTLQRKTSDIGATFEPVKSQLVTPNPVEFEITRDTPTNLTFSFATAAGAIDIGRNQLNVGLGVIDCSTYDQFTASLATLTVDCLGTIDSKSFDLDKDGLLTRTFDKCPNGDEKMLQSIKDLLGLQLRTKQLPYAKECIAGRWEAWRKTFNASGVTACPVWKKTGVVHNEPTPELIDKLVPELKALSFKENGVRPTFIAQLKTANEYAVGFSGGATPTSCRTAGECAASCAGGFPGFVIRVDRSTLLTDPTYWLLDRVFPTPADNPFMRPGYFHPMSYFGPLPGALFAHRNREKEACSHYEGGIHYMFQLKSDCLNPGSANETCVTQCIP